MRPRPVGRVRAAALALAGALLVLPSVGCSQETASDKAFGERVRAYLLAHPEVLQEALERLQTKEEAEAATSARAAIATHRRELERDPRDPVAGSPDGKVTVVEFFDYRCPYCKASDPEIPAVLKRHPEVRFVYKEFPILSPESEQAARLALAASRQGKYAAVHSGFMKLPKLDTATMDAVLTEAGVDVARAKADAASPAVTKQIDDVHALARDVGVNGTPAFVVGDRLENGWSASTLEADIAAAGGAPAKG